MMKSITPIAVSFLLVSCSYATKNTTIADTTAHVEVLAIDSGVSETVETSEATARVFDKWDSLYEMNSAEGVLTNELPGTDGLKFFIYGWEMYDGQPFAHGETAPGIVPILRDQNITRYQINDITFQYDSSIGYVLPPFISEENERPVFFLKGVRMKNVVGMQFPDIFFHPGDTVSLTIQNTHYRFYIEGERYDNIYHNYRIILERDNKGKLTKQILVGRRYTPFPGVSDIVPDFIMWAGDINDDGLIDIISGNGMKSCASYSLWKGESDNTFVKLARFEGCGC